MKPFVVPLPPKDYSEPVYQNLEEMWGLHFTRDNDKLPWNIRSAKYMEFFAYDSMGNWYANVGGANDIEYDLYPIVCVTADERYITVASGIVQFLGIFTWFPRWYTAVLQSHSKKEFIATLDKNKGSIIPSLNVILDLSDPISAETVYENIMNQEEVEIIDIGGTFFQRLLIV